MNNFKSLSNIVTSFNMIRAIAIISIIASLITCLVSIGTIYTITTNEYVVVVDNVGGNAFMGQKSTKEDNISAEIEGHLSAFYRTFFTYNANNINEQLEIGLELGGNDVKEFYKTLAEKGWMNNVKQNNIELISSIDSISINENTYPYQVVIKGRQVRYRGSFSEIYTLDMTCVVFDTYRSEQNPHGLIIEQLEVRNINYEDYE